MKKTIFTVMVITATTFVCTQLQAQENARPDQKIKTKSNIKNDKISVVQINSTASGCSITFGEKVQSGREAGSGLATGKRMHKPFVITKELDISSKDNSMTEVTSPKTGQGAGKASYSDLSVMIQVKGKSIKLDDEDGEYAIPSDCPNGDCTMIVSWSWGASNSGAAKRCEKAFTITMEDGACKSINEKGIK
jgi:hypothetical protein